MSHHMVDTPAGTERRPLVIARHEGGFRVYAPQNPRDVYIVSGELGSPTCTCPDFDRNGHGWRCEHILAVRHRNDTQIDTTADREALEEHGIAAAGSSTMLLKRSVSPDGRIDSLSVEFACPVNGLTSADIETRAKRALSLQTAIVAGFLGKGTPSPNSGPNDDRRVGQPATQGEGDGPVPATLLGVGGLDTRWGRRLFIEVQVGDSVLKLFGSPNQLARTLSEAGHQQHAGYVDEGMQLNLPCRVTTKPSDNGRSVNIDRVLPVGPYGGR